MAANKRARGAVRADSGRRVPGWVWLFTGVVTGLFIAFLVHLAQLRPPQESNAGVPEEGAVNPKDQDKKGDKPRFDFYAVLPKMEVIVPKGEEDTPPTRREGKEAEPSGDLSHRHDERYLLQAGSFRTADDADRRRAELILQGYDVQIQAVELDSGSNWHRVMVGPFDNKNTLHRAQDQLARRGIETLPIKQKSGE